MKYIFTFLLITLVTIQVQAQDYKFGKVSKAELEQSVSNIDPDANAEYLFKKEHIYYIFSQDEGFIQKKEVYFRIKIYNKEGLNWANHSIRLYNQSASKRTKLVGEKGYTYNLEDGKIKKTKLKSEGVFEEVLNEYWKKTSFALPNVKEGSVIELKYELEEPFVGSIDDIYIQEMIPIQKIDIKVMIPEYYNFNKLVNPKAAFYPKLVESTKNRKEIISNKERTGVLVTRTSFSNSNFEFQEKVTSIEMENIPPLKIENYVDNLQNYVAKIVWEYSFYKGPDGEIRDYTSNWEKVSKTIFNSPNFGGQLSKTGYFEDDLTEVISGINDPMEKVAVIFQFVKSKVKWNDFYGIYTNDGVRRAYKNGSGNVSEINLMLTTMLRYAGLNASPVLVSTKSHGIPITATLDGFNYVVSAIEAQNGLILLDATEAYALPNILPRRAMNWQGRLIRGDGTSTWASLQQRKPVLDSKTINFKITADLEVEGKIREYKSLQLAQNARRRESKLSLEQNIEKLENRDFDISIADLQIKDKDNYTKPYLKSYNFTSDELIEEIGDKLYISPLLFFTVEESPFKEETRKYPIDFVFPFSDKYMVNIMMPEGYEVEYLPESVASNLANNNLSNYKYIAKKNGSYIQLSINFDFNSSFVPVEDYVDFRQYFNSYLEKLSDKIILRKI